MLVRLGSIAAVAIAVGGIATAAQFSSLWDRLGALVVDWRRGGDHVLFVGDIMLARHVETLSRAHGGEYPYRDVTRFHLRYPAVVGNFEAAMADPHEHTPNFAMRFSVADDLLAPLAASGVTHLSLANNHALDYGEEGYRHARASLEERGFMVFGHATRAGTESIAYIDAGASRVALVGLHTLWREPTGEELADIFAEAGAQSDVQIAYVHWGVEYEPRHHPSQEAFARTLIDLGADAVIGTHPHVVQDIGAYRGAPIFYSLGNYIFDQYWEDAVQTGLALGIGIYGDSIVYELHPIRSERSAPRIMVEEERAAFLAALADRSASEFTDDIREGRFESRH